MQAERTRQEETTNRKAQVHLDSLLDQKATSPVVATDTNPVNKKSTKSSTNFFTENDFYSRSKRLFGREEDVSNTVIAPTRVSKPVNRPLSPEVNDDDSEDEAEQLDNR